MNKKLISRNNEGESYTSKFIGYSYFKLPEWSGIQAIGTNEEPTIFHELTITISPTNNFWFIFRLNIRSKKKFIFPNN